LKTNRAGEENRVTFLRVAACLYVLSFTAWPAAAQSLERGYIDVNFGLAVAASDAFEAAALFPYDGIEDTRFDAAYSLPRGASFDFGGGVMITPFVGVGVSFSGTAHEESADFAIEVPHPRFVNAYGGDEAFTEEKLQRVEGGVNVQGMFVLPTGSDLRVRVFGGPTYFRVRQDLIDQVNYLQNSGVFTTLNQIDITTFTANEYEATGWGFNVGGDVSYFFTRVFGVGGFGRYSRGTAALDDVDVEATGVEEFKAGGLQVGGGIRLKF
jgi:hypothetical protein